MFALKNNALGRVFVMAVVCAMGCTELELEQQSRRTQPLIGGTLDTGDPAVVALKRGGASSAFCTGTLVSPTVVLTAAHCIDMAGADPNIIAFFGSDIAGEGRGVSVTRKHQNINWDGNVGANDIGLLLLGSPQDPTLPVPMNISPLTGHVGDDYRHVGFGVYDRDTQASDGKKRTGVTTITGTGGDVVLSGDSNLSVCFGDSGGPGLITIDEVEYIAGIHSYTTGQNCNPPNGDTRVDLYVQDFIMPWIQENDPACGMDYLCSTVGCTDDPDCTPCGADGTCTSDCALPDPDCPTSEIGDICQTDSQCKEGSCVFWRQDTTFHFCANACTSGSGCPADMACIDVVPFGKICYYEDDPVGVIGDGCAEATECGTYLCVDNQCVKPCDLSKGLTCPELFTCGSSAEVPNRAQAVSKSPPRFSNLPTKSTRMRPSGSSSQSTCGMNIRGWS